jgi:hypothetical protein
VTPNILSQSPARPHTSSPHSPDDLLPLPRQRLAPARHGRHPATYDAHPLVGSYETVEEFHEKYVEVHGQAVERVERERVERERAEEARLEAGRRCRNLIRSQPEAFT